MAELPAENGAAGQREAESVGPEGVGSLLPVSPQDDSCWQALKEACTTCALPTHSDNKRKFDQTYNEIAFFSAGLQNVLRINDLTSSDEKAAQIEELRFLMLI